MRGSVWNHRNRSEEPPGSARKLGVGRGSLPRAGHCARLRVLYELSYPFQPAA